MSMHDRRKWCLINVQKLIPTVWRGDSNRSERASPMRVVRKRAHRHGPNARRSNLSLEASEALSFPVNNKHYIL